MSLATKMKSLLGGTTKAIVVVTREEARATDSSGPLASVSSAMSNVGMSLDTSSQDIFVVQYNPSSLSIAANAVDTSVKAMQQGADANALVQTTRPPSFVLTVDLIFDDTNNADCFYEDNFTLSATNAVATVASLVKTYSVRPEMEGFLSTVMNNNLREVSFIWGGMLFSGQVNYATATYTMFSTGGVPIRGNIQFQIRQSIGSVDTSTYWSDAIQKIEDGEFKKEWYDFVTGI